MNAGDNARRDLLVAVGAVALLALATSPGPAAATLLVAGAVGTRSRGMTGLVGWIVGGALLGGAMGYAADAFVTLPLARAGSIGLGTALGGGLGGISHLLSTDDPSMSDDERMTVDMASQSSPEPRPVDLFDEHPDPLLYVTDAGGGPVVRAANAAYERAFDLPATTIEEAPLGDVLVTAEGSEEIVDRATADERIDAVYTFETPGGTQDFRVRSVATTADGYLLFTPVGDD